MARHRIHGGDGVTEAAAMAMASGWAASSFLERERMDRGNDFSCNHFVE